MDHTTADREDGLADPGDPAAAPPSGVPSAPEPPLSESPRRSFHLLLGSIFLPGFAAPIVWAFAAFWMRRAVGTEARRWARRILGLAVLDTLVAVAMVFLLAPDNGLGGVEHRSIGGPAAARDRVMIGVVLDESFPGPGARVESVFPGGPAAVAGVRAGDVIVRVDGVEIDGADTLVSVASVQEAGIPVALEWRREGEVLRAEAVPEWASRLGQLPAGDPEPAEDRTACFTDVSAAALLPTAAVLVLLGILVVLAGRRGSAGIGWTALSLLGGFGGAFLAAGGTCALGAGGQPLAALWGSALGIAGTALLGLRRAGSVGAASPPSKRWTSAFGLACWYTVAGGLRLGILIAALLQLASPGGAPADELASMVQAAAPEGPELLLLVLPIVLFGPVGEELAFRGLLQPALARRWGTGTAIAVTSVLFTALHWHYGLRLPMVFFLSVILGWARAASGGLRAPILLHAAVNGVTLLGWWWTAR